MTEESLERGGRAAQKAIDEAGFSEELKKRLEARIQDTKFRSENPAAFAQMDMPVHPRFFCTACNMADLIIVKCWQRDPTDRCSATMVRYRDSRRRSSSNAYRR